MKPTANAQATNGAAPEMERTEAALLSAYESYSPLLHYLARQRFNVPDADAENLVQEVFFSYMSNFATVKEPRAWLVGAICNASRHYWRSQRRTQPLPEGGGCGTIDDVERLAIRIAVQDTLSRLQDKCQRTLKLRYYEGLSAKEIAAQLSTTQRYAEKLLHKCLGRAREIYSRLTTTTSQ